MKPSIYSIEISTPGLLYMMPKPSGEWLAEDVQAYGEIGVNRIVSLLTLEETKELDLLDEESICRSANIDFDHHSIMDRHVPEKANFTNLVKSVAQDLSRGRNVAVHCRAGIGRSGTLCCCVLQELGVSPGDALERVSVSRGLAVPDTDEQLAFIHNYRNFSA